MEIVLKSGRKIGEGHPPYIIAEVGSNWRNLEDCIKSIHEAKIAGADAVKFQLFTPDELYGLKWTMYGEPGMSDVGLGWAWDFKPCETKMNLKPTPLGSHIEEPIFNEELQRGIPRYSLPPEWLPKLKAEADKRDIDFMCTAFSPEGYELVDKYVDVHKIASSECCHLRILQKLKQLGKPVILSTGAKGIEDIKMAVKALESTPTILMYCVVAYPSRWANCSAIPVMRDYFKLPVGYSDHTIDVYHAPVLAQAHGACVIEKHFTIDREMKTPDAEHSLNPIEFKAMVSALRTKQTEATFRTPEEKTALLKYNRRLIVTKDINPGDQLQENVNFGIYRSLKDDTRAASPFLVDKFIGKRVKVSLKAGDGLWLDDLEA